MKGKQNLSKQAGGKYCIVCIKKILKHFPFLLTQKFINFEVH